MDQHAQNSYRVAAAVYSYKSYPTKVDYDHVARQIVAKYPFMCDQNESHVRYCRLETSVDNKTLCNKLSRSLNCGQGNLVRNLQYPNYFAERVVLLQNGRPRAR